MEAAGERVRVGHAVPSGQFTRSMQSCAVARRVPPACPLPPLQPSPVRPPLPARRTNARANPAERPPLLRPSGNIPSVKAPATCTGAPSTPAADPWSAHQDPGRVGRGPPDHALHLVRAARFFRPSDRSLHACTLAAGERRNRGKPKVSYSPYAHPIYARPTRVSLTTAARSYPLAASVEVRRYAS